MTNGWDSNSQFLRNITWYKQKWQSEPKKIYIICRISTSRSFSKYHWFRSLIFGRSPFWRTSHCFPNLFFNPASFRPPALQHHRAKRWAPRRGVGSLEQRCWCFFGGGEKSLEKSLVFFLWGTVWVNWVNYRDLIYTHLAMGQYL